MSPQVIIISFQPKEHIPWQSSLKILHENKSSRINNSKLASLRINSKFNLLESSENVFAQ